MNIRACKISKLLYMCVYYTVDVSVLVSTSLKGTNIQT